MLPKDGYARYTPAYDARGNAEKSGIYGTDGKPTLKAYGNAVIKRANDPRGNPIEMRFLDGEAGRH